MRPHENLNLWKKAIEFVIAFRLNYIRQPDFRRLSDDLDHIGRMITKLSQSLATR
jgi:hypothetical protein